MRLLFQVETDGGTTAERVAARILVDGKRVGVRFPDVLVVLVVFGRYLDGESGKKANICLVTDLGIIKHSMLDIVQAFSYFEHFGPMLSVRVRGLFIRHKNVTSLFCLF